MPGSEKAQYVAAGAVAGVITILALLLGLMNTLDARYIPRGEYRATLERLDSNISIVNTNVKDLKVSLDKHMDDHRKGS